ncbi:MAG TPA: tRNA (adenosine(37)-N6)-threonylcarbamoyltransferase complex dimerization subunit type 1 TsaB [Phycicoccus sp.]|nr:tRNA (adenosine(37)-N6)-threonylcarbamoyltransferase complex dimerization subunit type 1 TsaB [Phycicoccus sp.]
MTIDRSVKLGIDTSTSAIAVAVSDGDETLVRERIDPLGHSEHLAPLIAEALQDSGIRPADLTMIAVGNGPGPFTGLRVGMVTGLTMGHALGIPVVGVCSLDVLAAQADAADGSEFLVASDARRKEVYWAVYAGGSPFPVRLTDPAVSRPADLPESVRSLPSVGRGAVLYPDLLSHEHLARRGGGADGPVLDVDAGVLLAVVESRLAAGDDLPVEPLYLRRPDALTLAERGVR